MAARDAEPSDHQYQERNEGQPAQQQRPWGFRDFVKARGYCSLYLLSAGTRCPIKVGLTDDPVRRLCDFQIAHYRPLEFHRVWWLPGKPIAARLENAFKFYFQPVHVRGEWYNTPHERATAFVEDTIASLGTWGISQADIEERMMHWARKRHDLPKDAPIDLCGLRTMQSRARRR